MNNYTLKEFLELTKYNPFLGKNTNIKHSLSISTNIGNFYSSSKNNVYKNCIFDCWKLGSPNVINVIKENFEINIKENKIIPQNNNIKIISYKFEIARNIGPKNKISPEEFISFNSKEINSYRLFYKESFISLYNNNFNFYENENSDPIKLEPINYEDINKQLFKQIKKNLLFL